MYRHAPGYYSKYNAKSFDIEVDIEDIYSYIHVNHINNMVYRQRNVDRTLCRKYNTCMYIAKSIRQMQLHIQCIDDKLKYIDNVNASTTDGIDSILGYSAAYLAQSDPVQSICYRTNANVLGMCCRV